METGCYFFAVIALVWSTIWNVNLHCRHRNKYNDFFLALVLEIAECGLEMHQIVEVTNAILLLMRSKHCDYTQLSQCPYREGSELFCSVANIIQKYSTLAFVGARAYQVSGSICANSIEWCRAAFG